MSNNNNNKRPLTPKSMPPAGGMSEYTHISIILRIITILCLVITTKPSIIVGYGVL